MLDVQDLIYSYGANQVLHGVSLSVGVGEIVALVGANGAGKTTTLRCISGLLAGAGGTVRLNDLDLSRAPPHKVSRSGIGHVLEGRHLFPHLTVRENLDMGAWKRRDTAAVGTDLERVYTLFPRVKERLDQVAGTLSGGEQQMVAMARAIMGKPEVLLLDEPSMGLAPRVTDVIFEIIADVAAAGLPILLVEQNANRALAVADRAGLFPLSPGLARKLAVACAEGRIRNIRWEG